MGIILRKVTLDELMDDFLIQREFMQTVLEVIKQLPDVYVTDEEVDEEGMHAVIHSAQGQPLTGKELTSIHITLSV